MIELLGFPTIGEAPLLQMTASTMNEHMVIDSDMMKLKQDTVVEVVEFGQLPQSFDKML